MYRRIFNANFNKLITNSRSRVRFLDKKEVDLTHLCQDFFIFSFTKSLSCNKTLTILGL